jgi:hypothetical protein
MLLWIGPLFALPLWLAKITYGKREWVSATMGVMAATSLLWWIHGVLPHAWIQFTESNANLLEGTIIPATVGRDRRPRTTGSTSPPTSTRSSPRACSGADGRWYRGDDLGSAADAAQTAEDAGRR